MAKRYFEFSEGTSNKFWEIDLEGASVTTRYGKIGTDGQMTLKEEGTPDKAQKLYDKLVKEKTGKGYVEKTAGGGSAAPAAVASKPAGADFKAAWAALVNAKNLPEALEQHLSFLCDTPACKKVLKDLCAAATSAKASDETLTVVFTSPDGTEFEGEEWTMEASPPYTGKYDKLVPKSHQRFASVHNGMSLEGLDVPLSFSGVNDGMLTGSSFEDEYLEESEPELYEKFQDKELPIVDVIGHHQDWVLYNFLKKTKLGEPALQYISHEGGGLDAPYDQSLGVTGVFLRLLASDVLGTNLLRGEGGDDDEGGDDEGDSGDGGEGARRFEFSEDGSNKFWEIRLEGASHTVRYGKIGTDGQTKTKDFDDEDAAKKDHDKLIAEKTKKGYVEVGDSD